MRLAFLFIICSTQFILGQQQDYHKTLIMMGTNFEISVVANNKTEGKYYIDMAIKEINRIEKLISSWDKNSQTSLINNNAGIKPVKVDY